MRTFEKILKQIQRDDWFDKHVVKKVRATTWFCHKHGEGSIQSFWVTVQPGAIVMWGDMGEAIYTVYGGSSMAWGKRNFRFPDACSYYPFTKLAPQMREERFSTEAATDYLKQQVEEAKTSAVLDEDDLARAEKMLAEWEDRRTDDPREDEAAWWTLWSDFGDPDAPDMCEFTPRVYWPYFCLCWFFAQADISDERFTEAYSTWRTDL